MIHNPFLYGNPVAPSNFFNRRGPVRRVVGRLISSGQSTAIIGGPRIGKTSLMRYLARRLYREQELLFTNIWRNWTPATRKAFTAVALVHMAHLLPKRKFLTKAFIKQLPDWGPELDDLEMGGLLARDKQVDGGWRVAPQAMLWWLADELVRNVRDDETSFGTWLRAQEMDGKLTRQQRDQLSKGVRGAVQVLTQGATTLVEAFAAGVGASLAGGG